MGPRATGAGMGQAAVVAAHGAIQNVYDALLNNFFFPNLVKLYDFLGGIQHCVTVVGRCMFNINIPFVLTLYSADMD